MSACCPVCDTKLIKSRLLRYSIRLYCKECRRYITIGPEHPIGSNMQAKLLQVYEQLQGA